MAYVCPVDPAHGRLLDVYRGDLLVWWCPHSDHSATAGRIFTEAQATGKEPVSRSTEEAAYAARLEDRLYEKEARMVLAGEASKEDAVARIAKAKKASKAAVAERLDLAIEAEKSALKEAAKTAPKAKRPAQARTRTPADAGKPRLEHVEPAVFAALRDELGLTNKECAAANEAAGLGSTLSRITELTASKGASSAILARVDAAWRDYAKKENTLR